MLRSRREQRPDSGRRDQNCRWRLRQHRTAFFEELVINMADALGAAAGFIARFQPGTLHSACTKVAVVDGRLIPNSRIRAGRHALRSADGCRQSRHSLQAG